VPWILLAPVVALAAAWILLSEVPSPADLAGAALLVIGVLVAQGIVRQSRKTPDWQIPAEIQTHSLERTRDSADTATFTESAESRAG